MHKYIKRFETTARMPGYLYILSYITYIGENIILQCAGNKFEFFSSMLKLIGIETSSLTNTDDSKQLYMMESIQALATLNWKDNLSCRIVYIDDKAIKYTPDALMDTFLYHYPNTIIVINIKSNVSEKCFSVWINEKNRYYAQLQNIC